MVPPPGISDGQAVDDSNSNAAWLAKNGDDTTIGKVTLAKADPTNSGGTINDAQRELNSLDSFVGKTPNVPGPLATPTYTANDGFTPSETLRARVDALSSRFNGASGHTHTGAAGDAPPIDAGAGLTNVPLRGYFIQGATLLGVSGASEDVSAALVGKTPSTGSSTPGVVVNAPYNKVMLRQGSGANEDDQFVDNLGNVVYGRLTESSGVWTLSYYVLLAGTETAYSFSGSPDVKWYYQELFNPMLSPPVYSELAIIPSDNVTQDVATATTTLQGKVQLASSAAQPVGSASGAGTANATVANADHTHQGVHSVFLTGEGVQVYGDVELEPSSGVTITRSGNKFTFAAGSSLQPYQERPSGIPDGILDTFGLTHTPYNQDSAIVYVDGLQRDAGTHWNLSGSNIVFTAGNIPAIGQEIWVWYLRNAAFLSSNVAPRTEYRTISSGEAASKSLTLSNTPSISGEVQLDVIGGGPQFYGSDFTVSGATLSWLGLALDGVLSAGDRLRIHYFY